MEEFVISLGGSILVPEEIDQRFLKEFHLLIKNNLKNKKFYIIVGGGNICRQYQSAAKNINPEVPKNELDMLGIHVTHVNAQLVRSVFGKLAYREIFKDPNDVKYVREKVYVGGGWKPGNSTDYVATLIAKKMNVRTVINLSNIDYVYTKDPNKYKSAKPIKRIDWADFRKIVGNKWVPGAHLPFDPVACQLAEKSKMRVIVMNADNLANLESFIQGREFKGTIIE